MIDYAKFCARHGKFKEAEEFFSQAINLKNEVHDSSDFESQQSFAEFLIHRHEYSRAEALLEKTYKTKKTEGQYGEFPNESFLAPLALDLGKSYLESKNYELAEHYLKVAMRGRSHLDDVAQTYAKLWKARGDIPQAKIWDSRAITMTKYEMNPAPEQPVVIDDGDADKDED